MFARPKSPNFGPRRGGAKPSMIILHYTGMKTAAEALERLCNKTAEVSAHYFVDENGRVTPLVPVSKRAWHAGKSCWAGERDVNSHSIGIEIVNPGHEFGYREFPQVQINAVIKLCKKIIRKHKIPARNILGHSDIAPERKEDPGELFPWAVLAEQGVGLWPEPFEMDFTAAQDILLNPAILHDLFYAYGYDPEASSPAIIRAFHRHFCPEKFAPGQKPEEADLNTVARLLALTRAGHASQNL